MPDGMLMFSDLNGEYFYLERLEQEAAQPVQYCLPEEEKNAVLREIMGTYVITEFLLTKFYPANDSAGDIYLPMEEAKLMVGKEVTIEEDQFISYDNMRRPNSEYVGRAMDDFRLEQIEMTAPDYQVDKISRTELYGLKSDICTRKDITSKELSHIPFQGIVKIFPGSCHNHNDYFPFRVLHRISQFIIGLVIVYIISVNALEISCFFLSCRMILPNPVNSLFIQLFQLFIFQFL